jgi:uncharacterized protein (DUF58 family)
MNALQLNEVGKKVRQLEVRTRRLVSENLTGRYRSVFRGRGMDFDDIREYVAGDEVRAIDWNVTARYGHSFVKKFTEERELTILLLVDVSASGEFGSSAPSKREFMAEMASVLALTAIYNHDRVGLILFSDQVELYLPPKRGRRHVQRLVRDILCCKAQRTGTDLRAALDFANRQRRRRALTFLISDFQGAVPSLSLSELRRSLRRTSRCHDLIAFPIEDPRERELPNVGLVVLEDAETGEVLELDTSDAELRTRFASAARARMAQLRRLLRDEGVDELALDTTRPYVSTLREFFKRRERTRQ